MAGAIIDMVSQHWGTPESLLEPTRFILGGRIDLDPCSNANAFERVAAKAAIWLPEEADGYVGPQIVPGNPYSSLNGPPEGVIVGDGLTYDWTQHKNVFVNPPYGRDKARGTSIYNWIEKCAETGEHIPVLALIPAAVGTKHWQDIIFETASQICFLRGRVKFLLPGKDNVSTTPSALVLWGGSDAMDDRFAEANFKYKLGKLV